ncbi:MAG: ABC transporter ATP-binding protein [Actinomycetota bacterium]
MTLELRHIDVRFGGATVLAQVSLRIETAEIVALLGPSGAGKTTLLRVVAGLVTPDGGAVLVDDRDVTDVAVHDRGVGLVFQDNQLFPHRDVAGNVEFGLRMQRLPRAQREARVSDMLQLVGLEGFEHRAVTSLSGGEAKRVALARSLAPGPPILLLDEPLTGLDDDLHDRLAADLATILRATSTTTLLVTHDVDEAHAIADRVVLLSSLSA